MVIAQKPRATGRTHKKARRKKALSEHIRP